MKTFYTLNGIHTQKVSTNVRKFDTYEEALAVAQSSIKEYNSAGLYILKSIELILNGETTSVPVAPPLKETPKSKEKLDGKNTDFVKVFWELIKLKKLPKEKLDLLIDFSKIVIERIDKPELQKRREAFLKAKHLLLPDVKDRLCLCCQFPAEVRHHVIQLKNGGTNYNKNVVPLCESCHGKIHPHIKIDKNY